ncbi:hypothetical protein [Pseudomonas hamedanensis]|uniref:Uncharacterized protein n=1 Tax=Pseudomonas hamedanensis TaxID=2745504 RepID=A0A9E6P4J9_9PSED|nr:hypothetical protein [Pseudomonas hamedanensis]QXI19800.1 hypothetical protein HU739_012605 [Pseudomonas hamedanensis]
MQIAVSIIFALILMVLIKGIAYAINFKCGPIIQKKHLQLIAIPVVICLTIYGTPKLMVLLGLN